MATYLITRNDIAQYRQISKTPNDDKLKEMILDAQLLDAQPLLGETLYNKIIAAPEDYTELLEGGQYQYNDVTYTNNGLKMVLCYFAFARNILLGSAIDTPHSVVQKLNEGTSQPVDYQTKKSIYGINRDAAFQLWDNVHNYLIRTNNPDYRHCNTAAQVRSFRLTKIE